MVLSMLCWPGNSETGGMKRAQRANADCRSGTGSRPEAGQQSAKRLKKAEGAAKQQKAAGLEAACRAAGRRAPASILTSHLHFSYGTLVT